MYGGRAAADKYPAALPPRVALTPRERAVAVVTGALAVYSVKTVTESPPPPAASMVDFVMHCVPDALLGEVDAGLIDDVHECMTSVVSLPPPEGIGGVVPQPNAPGGARVGGGAPQDGAKEGGGAPQDGAKEGGPPQDGAKEGGGAPQDGAKEGGGAPQDGAKEGGPPQDGAKEGGGAPQDGAKEGGAQQGGAQQGGRPSGA